MIESYVNRPFMARDFVDEVMKMMEERQFTQAEAEAIPKMLKTAIQENSEYLERGRAFTVFRKPKRN